MFRKPGFLIQTLILMASASTTFAQDSAAFGPWIWNLEGGYVEQLDTDIDDADGEFGFSRSFLEVGLNYAWDRDTSVGLSIGFGTTDYDFDRGTSIDGLTLWDEVKEERVSVPIRFAPTDNANVIIVPSIRSNYEDGARFSEGQTEGLIFGAAWKLSDTLTLGPGLGWFTELEGGSTAFPIILVDWQITDRWSLATGGGLAASRGPGLSSTYEFSDELSVSTAVRYERIQFALDNDQGIGQHSSTLLIGNLNYSPWPMTTFSIFAGMELGGELELQNGSGSRLAGSDFDAAPMFGITFTSLF